MALVNLHNHTSLCGHAQGTTDEYIEAAIKLNTAYFGFADHAPISEDLRPGITMEPEDTEIYIAMIQSVKEKYAKSIEVLLGFEVDFPLFNDFETSYFKDSRIDYLIGSCHFIDGWAFDNSQFIDEFSKRDINDIYARYFDILADLIDSRLFNIIGHFDIVKKFGHRATNNFSAVIETLAKKTAAANMAIEVNTAGLLKPVGEMYPSKEILDIFFRCNAAVTMGSDSHAPEHVGYGYDKAIEMLKAVGYQKVVGFRKRKMFEVNL